MVKQRIRWIDLSKGIVILLVIIGHLENNPFMKSESVLRGLIFSFHMPFFFIASGYTSSSVTNTYELKNRFMRVGKKLLIPFALTFVITVFWDAINQWSAVCSVSYWKARMYTIIFASGVNTVFNGINIGALGISWFFFALLGGRVIFDFLILCSDDTKQLVLRCIITGMMGVAFGLIQWMPFSLDIALATTPFFLTGYLLRQFDFSKAPIITLFVSFLIWTVSLYITFFDYQKWTYMELAARRYSLFPLCYFTAIAGSVFMLEMCFVMSQLNAKVFFPLEYIGKNSINLLGIHIVDYIWYGFWHTDSKYQFMSALRRVGLDLTLFGIIMLVIEISKRLLIKNGVCKRVHIANMNESDLNIKHRRDEGCWRH